MPLARAVSMMLNSVALAVAPRGLPVNSQFFLLCRAQHKRNYAESGIMLSSTSRNSTEVAKAS